jgi:hypothetical protein
LRTGALVLVCFAGCSETLPGGDLGEPGAAPGAKTTLPIVSGCMPFREIAGLDAVSGAVRSLAGVDGGIELVVDDAIVGGRHVPSLALAAPAGATLDDCLSGAAVSGTTPMPALDPPTLTPLAVAAAGSGPAAMYFLDASGAVGVALQDPADGRFRSTAGRLWTSNYPPYGSAAVPEGSEVDVLGCLAARFLDSDCFLARAPAGKLADESAYAYYVGGGRFSPRVDDAWPMATGAASFDLAPRPALGRWLMVYVTPLGATITLRSGLAPQGPWSAPIPIATCDLADADMFCAGIRLHPLIASAPGTVVVSYSAASFSSDAAARRAAEPGKWWPRFVSLALPPSLP